MNVGQRVLLIAALHECNCIPPPIGAVGTITVLQDTDGDYEVSFPDHIWSVADPDWFVPPWAIVPIDDGDMVKTALAELSV